MKSLSFATFLCLFAAPLAGLLSSAHAADAQPIGAFDEQSDIGAVHFPGGATYDATEQAYTLSGSGTNMWVDHDEYHFVWKKITGDFIIQAQVELTSTGGNGHRKVGIIARNSLDPRSPHVNAARHGDGLTSFQYRRTEGGTTEEKRFDLNGADVIQLARHGHTFTMSAAHFGEIYKTQTIDDVDLGETLYVGLYVCAHDNTRSESARFHNVRLIRPAKDTFRPYHDYIGSDVETMDVTTGVRKIVYHVDDSIQAPNWLRDNRHFIMNHNGKIVNFDLAKHTLSPVNTGKEDHINNDHAISFNGRELGISSGAVSTVYILPIKGGTPKQLTTKNPSYLHCWSPDGKYLVYTGLRGSEPGDIYRISVKGGEEQRLTDAPGLDDGSEYTPDGQYIYFNSNRTGRMQLWRMKPDGSNQEQITKDDFNNWFAHVSPDGKSIVFLSYGADIPSAEHPFYKQVYIRKLSVDDAADPKVIGYLYGGQGSMNVNSWSPDSKSIAFVSNSDRI
jgi:dipeptidyl aminopeptidase/acylaminoacyl peptidase